MAPKRNAARLRDMDIGLHNLLGVPVPQILRAEEDEVWRTLRALPGGRGVQATVLPDEHHH